MAKILGVHLKPAVTDWVSYVPTFSASFGTTSGVTAFYRRIGDAMEGRIVVTSGTLTAALGSISLPAGLAIDTTKVANVAATAGSAGGGNFGSWNSDNGATGSSGGITVATSTDTAKVYVTGMFAGIGASGSDRFINMSALSSTDAFHIFFKVPIAGWHSKDIIGGASNL